MEEQLLITEVEKYTQIRKISTPKGGGSKKQYLQELTSSAGGVKGISFGRELSGFRRRE